MKGRKLSALAIVLATAVAILLCAAPAAAQSPASAWPFKQAGDSGKVDYYQYLTYAASSPRETGGFPDSPWWVNGFDACVWTDPIDQAKFNYQQWDVDGCVPIASPWIWSKAFSFTSWKIYCPGSAPYNWAAIPIGAQSFWFGEPSIEATFDFQENYKPGWSYHTAFNHDVSNGHHWKFIIGCSPTDQSDSVKHVYSNGEGPTGKPVPCCGVVGPDDAARGAIATKGPPVDTIRSASGYSQTREYDLRRKGRRRYATSCKRGHRLEDREWAIGWYTAKKPRPRLRRRAVARRVRAGRNRLVVKVTSRRLKRGAARLQTQIKCAVKDG